MRYTNDLILRAMARAKAVMETREKGATAVEYGLMLALIAVVVIVAVTAIGTRLNLVFGHVRDALPAA